PHKVTTIALLDEVMTTAAVAGACNAVRLDGEGRLIGDMFDGEGFVRGLLRKGRVVVNARALVVGCGGVGSAIAASLAKAGLAQLTLYDPDAAAMEALAGRLRRHYPQLTLVIGSADPSGQDIVANATPLGMKPGDPLPLAVDRIPPDAFVGEVVMSQEMTPFLLAARARGCAFQVGTDMLFEQIPAYLDFFGFPSTTPEALRQLAQLEG
ncbi:MAG: shikimate dehydrogenase family protein, partial [Bosea sp. (in: a-proteobacteria)]